MNKTTNRHIMNCALLLCGSQTGEEFLSKGHNIYLISNAVY